MRITTASVSTSGLISVFGLVGPIESENKDTGFAAIEGVFSNVSYHNSNERLMYIRGEGCKVFISQVSLSNIYTWTQNGAVIRFCGGSEVIIYSLESINTGGQWDGGVIGLWNSVATIYNLTARNTVCNCGGILALCQFSSATVYNMVGYNTTSRICGGIAYLERSQAKVINITAFDSFSGNDGGMVSVVANSNIEIQSLTSYRSRSGGNGAILCVNSSSTGSIGNIIDGTHVAGVLMVQESSSSGSGGVIFVEDSTLTINSSVSLSNVTALGSRGGGAFFVTGPKSNLFVRGTINIQNVTSVGGGGMAACTNGATCQFDNVESVVGAQTMEGPGGLMLLNGSSGNVKCQNLSNRGVVYARTGFTRGGCVYLAASTAGSTAEIAGCTFTSCRSKCLGEETAVLTSESSIGKNMISIHNVTYRQSTLAKKSLSQYLNVSTFEMAKETMKCSEAIVRGGIKKSPLVVLSNGIEVAGTFVSPIEVVVGVQMLQSVWICRDPGKVGDRHSILSLARFTDDVMQKSHSSSLYVLEAWEVMMLALSSGVTLALHCVTLLLMVMSGSRSTNEKTKQMVWLRSILKSKFPGFSLRYHITLIIPMVSSCTATVLLNQNLALQVYLVLSVILYISCAILIHMYSYTNTFVSCIVPTIQTRRKVTYWLLPRGEWTARFRETMGGVMFHSYAPVSGNAFSAHVWVWITLALGVPMAVVATLVEVDNHNNSMVEDGYGNTFVNQCNIVSVVSGCIAFICGCLHVRWVREIMSIRIMGFVRGIRLFWMGAVMAMVGVIGFVDESEHMRVILSYMVTVAMYSAVVETVINFALKAYARWKRWEQERSISIVSNIVDES
eukprot:PhF_6_TR13426/c0_g1_i5/m.21416